ncbi:MAG: TadE/TadG family type IV pilus assembly protein [Anaerolineae bacterium]
MKRKDVRERGQSLVEVAILFPILVLLLLGVADLGRAYYAVVALRDAAEEGALYAAIDPANLTEIRNRAVHASSGLVTFEPDRVTRSPSSGFQAGEPVTVTVTYDFEFYTPIIQTFFDGGTVTLRGEAVNVILTP